MALRKRRHLIPYFFIAPALFYLLIMVIFPTIYTLYLSFHRWNFSRPKLFEFIGFRNYINAILWDSRFHNSLIVTLTILVGATFIELMLGLGLAILVDSGVRLRKYFITLLLVPVLMIPVVSGHMWHVIFYQQTGPLTFIITSLGGPEILWLATSTAAPITVIMTDVWQWTPFMFLILYAGLQSLPSEPFEAAQIDGATSWQTFRYLRLPMLKTIIIIAVILRGMDLLRIFDVITILTYGGPGSATETVSLYMYFTGFRWWDMGYTSALAYIMLIIVTIATTLLIRTIKRELMGT